MLTFSAAEMTYEPYPVGYLTSFIEENAYKQMLECWPELDKFEYMPKLGKKYSLSEGNNAGNYSKCIKATPVWTHFYQMVKSSEFIENTLQFLNAKNIDLGLSKRKIVSRRGGRRSSVLARLQGVTELSARFEFSMMAPDGGHILPHTDAPNKLITLVVSHVAPNEWDEKWGGGTEVCLPKDRSRIFNHRNKYMSFEEVDVIKKFPFTPNRCIIFIKTYNSWHQVSPIQAGSQGPMRRTLTINIESKV